MLICADCWSVRHNTSSGMFGADSALRLQGLKMAAEGTGKAKKRAVVAVARKLAVLLLTLWKRLEPSLCWWRDAGRRQ